MSKIWNLTLLLALAASAGATARAEVVGRFYQVTTKDGTYSGYPADCTIKLLQEDQTDSVFHHGTTDVIGYRFYTRTISVKPGLQIQITTYKDAPADKQVQGTLTLRIPAGLDPKKIQDPNRLDLALVITPPNSGAYRFRAGGETWFPLEVVSYK